MIDQKVESEEKTKRFDKTLSVLLSVLHSFAYTYPGSQAVKTCNGASLIMESHIPLTSKECNGKTWL